MDFQVAFIPEILFLGRPFYFKGTVGRGFTLILLNGFSRRRQIRNGYVMRIPLETYVRRLEDEPNYEV